MDQQYPSEKWEILENLAETLKSNPTPIIGQKIIASSSGQGGRDVTGLKVSVSAGSGETGTVIGNYVSVSVSGRDVNEQSLIQELKEASQTAKTGNLPEAWMSSLVKRLVDLGNDAVMSILKNVGWV